MRAKNLLVVLLLFMAGCKKELAISASKVEGTWELVSSSSGWSGNREYAPGNGNIITFSRNNYSQTIKTADTTYSFAGKFEIVEGKACNSSQQQTLIKFDGSSGDSVSLLDGKLTIASSECIADGGTYVYRKI